MTLQEALDAAVNGFKNRITVDNILFNNTTTELFGRNCQWDSEMLARMEASIASAKKTSCLPGVLPCIQLPEDGYDPIKYLMSHFRCLLEIYTMVAHGRFQNIDTKDIKEELKILYDTIRLMQHRDERPKEQHLSRFSKRLEDLQAGKCRGPICYHAGYKGHSIYINYFKDRDRLIGVICNLGDGLSKHTYKETDARTALQKVYPEVLVINDINSHVDAIHFAKTFPQTDNKASKNLLLEIIYNSGIRGDRRDFRRYSFDYDEPQQVSGNCVVKNYLQAFRSRVSRNMYAETFRLIRGVITTHINELDKSVRLTRDVSFTNASLAASQSIYQGNSCGELVDQLQIYGSPATQTASRIQPASQSVSSSSIPAVAGIGAGVIGGAIAYKALEESDWSPNQKAVATLGVGLLCAFFGKTAADSLIQAPQPARANASPRRLANAQNIMVRPRDVLSCRAC